MSSLRFELTFLSSFSPLAILLPRASLPSSTLAPSFSSAFPLSLCPLLLLSGSVSLFFLILVSSALFAPVIPSLPLPHALSMPCLSPFLFCSYIYLFPSGSPRLSSLLFLFFIIPTLLLYLAPRLWCLIQLCRVRSGLSLALCLSVSLSPLSVEFDLDFSRPVIVAAHLASLFPPSLSSAVSGYVCISDKDSCLSFTASIQPFFPLNSFM